MKNAIKKGFGLIIGQELAKFVIFMLVSMMAAKMAKDTSRMDDIKQNDPELYEFVKKYAKEVKEDT